MSAPPEVTELVRRFRDNYDAYISPTYKEAQLRGDFLDKLFKALGWDVYNEQDDAEQYRQVVFEASLKTAAGTKAPDYAFRLGGLSKFFVEAKKPSVELKASQDGAFQLRRYGWTAKLPLSILTDFEEFAVYDCRIRPKKTDKASAARIDYFTFEDYEARWDQLVGLFSPKAISTGAFDKYAASKKKRGTAEVDDEFLKDIESWRKSLAQNIALRNPSLTQRELNFVVQRTIDRIIFLRICEDRGVEDYKRLHQAIAGTDCYAKLTQQFHEADARYNSGLFHFQKENASTRVT